MWVVSDVEMMCRMCGSGTGRCNGIHSGRVFSVALPFDVPIHESSTYLRCRRTSYAPGLYRHVLAAALMPTRSSSTSTPRPNGPRSATLPAFRAQYRPGIVRKSRECEEEPSRVSEGNRSETRKARREWSAPFVPSCANCQERRPGTEYLFDVRRPRRRTSRASKAATRSRAVYSTLTCCHRYAGARRQRGRPCGRVLVKS